MVQKLFSKKVLISLILVTFGTFLFAVGFNSIVIPNDLGEGGVSGLTLLIYYTLGWEPAYVSFVLNSIIMAIGWKYLDRRTIYYTLLAIVLMSVFIKYAHIGVFVPENSLIAAITAGFIIGAGLGIVVLGNGSTAGSDIIALMMKKYLGINVAAALLLIDFFIVTPLTFVIGLERGVMTIIMLFIGSRTMNFVLEGFNPKKSVTIISDSYEEISQTIQQRVGRGITVLNGYGSYSKAPKHVLYLVVSRMQIIQVQRIIHEIDPRAFVTIADVQQVIGEGFTFYLNSETGEVEDAV